MNLKNATTQQKRNMATNHRTSIDLLQNLAKDESYGVRGRVGRNPNTPVDVLQELSKDVDVYVRRGISLNPNTPEYVLRNLIKDHHWDIRRNIGRHSKGSVNLLILLFEYEKTLKNPDHEVIIDLYENPKFPVFAKRVIETLFGDWA